MPSVDDISSCSLKISWSSFVKPVTSADRTLQRRMKKSDFLMADDCELLYVCPKLMCSKYSYE